MTASFYPSHSKLHRITPTAKKILEARTLEELCAAFNFIYSDKHQEIPEEDEAIGGGTAKEYFRFAITEPKRYSPFLDDLTIQLKRSNIDEIKTIIDVGCGTGIMTTQLGQLFPDALTIGFDVSSDMVKIAREYQLVLPTELRTSLFFEEGSIYVLDHLQREWGVGPADLVVARHVFQRLKDPLLALRRGLQATKNGGVFYMSSFCNDLRSDLIKHNLIENVKRRAVGRNGAEYLNFARCYLLAVLRAPGKNNYLSFVNPIRKEFNLRYISVEFSSFECCICIVK